MGYDIAILMMYHPRLCCPRCTHLVDKLLDSLPFPAFRDPRHIHVEVHLVDHRLAERKKRVPAMAI